MFDLLFRYPTKQDAIDARPEAGTMWFGEWLWNERLAVVQVYIPAVIVDEQEITPAEYFPGYWLWEARTEPWFMLELGLVIATERSTGFIHYTIFTEEQLTVARISPVLAGTNYPFGAPVFAP